MFVVDNARSKDNADGAIEEIKAIIARADGEVVNIAKWDERRFTYAIKRKRRGIYILSHWNGPPEAPALIERACQLSEVVLRVLNIVDEDGPEIKKYRGDTFGPRSGDRRSGSYDGPPRHGGRGKREGPSRGPGGSGPSRDRGARPEGRASVGENTAQPPSP